MRRSLYLGLCAFFTSRAFAGDTTWLSPEYKQIFQNPLPFPPDKVASQEHTDPKTGKVVKFYDIDVKPLNIRSILG